MSDLEQQRAKPPTALLRRVEGGAYTSTCDWGMCDHETVAFARSHRDPPDEWLSICATCAVGEFATNNHEAYPVDEIVWISDIEDVFDEEAHDGDE